MKNKYSAKEKHHFILESKKSSVHGVAKKHGIGTTTLREWNARYESMGIAGLQEAVGRSRRTEAEKQEAVLAYVQSNQSLEWVCKKYKIRSKTQLRAWIKQYNSHEKIKTTSSGGGIFMTKGRAVTFEEKVSSVEYCIANGKNYAATMERFDVSYQQIYSWVKKYEATGITALEDRRGKAKLPSALNESDLLNAKIKLLESQNKRLEMENDLLKKLEEIERRWS